MSTRDLTRLATMSRGPRVRRYRASAHPCTRCPARGLALPRRLRARQQPLPRPQFPAPTPESYGIQSAPDPDRRRGARGLELSRSRGARGRGQGTRQVEVWLERCRRGHGFSLSYRCDLIRSKGRSVFGRPRLSSLSRARLRRSRTVIVWWLRRRCRRAFAYL